MLPQFVIEAVERWMVRLHHQKRVDLYSLCSKHAPEVYAKNQRRQKIPEATRWIVWRRDAFTCVYCLADDAILTLDHIIPERLGGDYSPSNLVTACGKCNQRKGPKDVQKFVREPWLKKKREKNHQRISITQATQAQSHLLNTLQEMSKTTGASS